MAWEQARAGGVFKISLQDTEEINELCMKVEF